MSTLYRNGHVYSPASPRASALLVEGDRIAAVGTDDAVGGLGQAHGGLGGTVADTVVDLDGALVTPAFVDAHVHLTPAGLALTGLDLSGTASLADALDAVARYAAAHPGRTLLGLGWDETRWPERRPPTAAELDRAAGGAAVYLARVDKHSAVASPALMAAAGPLTGLPGYAPAAPLTLDAHHAVRGAAHATLSAADRTDAQRAARRRAASRGIAALHECGGPTVAGEEDFTGLLALAATEPGPEVYGYWGELGAADRAAALGAVGAGGDLFVDGALGSRTACLATPYADADTSGHLYLDAAQIAAHVVDCVETGVQAGFHAIGDRALAEVVAGFAAAAATVGLDRLRAGRHRIEHAEMPSPAVIRQLVELGLVASVQPGFDAAWGGASGMYAQRLGAERALTLNPFAALANVGVPLAFGSDAPVTPLDPWAAVRAAVHHRNPRHAVSARAAFAAHTRGGWRALGRDEPGMLVPGAPATFAVWDAGTPHLQDAPLAGDGRVVVPGLPDLAADAPSPRCLRTVVRGACIHVDEGDDLRTADRTVDKTDRPAAARVASRVGDAP